MSYLEIEIMSVLAENYDTCILTFSGITFRNCNLLLGILGIFFPVLWLIGVVIPPTEEAVVEATFTE